MGHYKNGCNSLLREFETHWIKAKILHFDHILIVCFEIQCGGVLRQSKKKTNLTEFK